MPKLVRDNIPTIIENNQGTKPSVYQANEEEYLQRLKNKLREEINEYLESGAAEELADILEVVYALSAQQGIDRKKLEEIRETKATRNGAFTQRWILNDQ